MVHIVIGLSSAAIVLWSIAATALGSGPMGRVAKGVLRAARVLERQRSLKLFEKSKGVSCATSKSRDDFVVVELAHFDSVSLHYRIAQRNLAVAANSDLLVISHTQNRGAVESLHSKSVFCGWANLRLAMTSVRRH